MDHPAESQREFVPAIVTAVYPDTWEVDVALAYSSGATVQRCKVQGIFLPEVHTEDRQSKVLIGRLDELQQAPIAIPIHNTMIPDEEKADHVYWSEHHGFRIKIREPGHQGELRPGDQVGELEIRSLKGERLLQVRIQEDGGVIRLDTPKTRVVLSDDEEKIEVHADGDVVVDAGGSIAATAGEDISAIAGGDIVAQAGGNVFVQASGDIQLQASGNITIAAAGTVAITGATVTLN